MAEDTNPSSRPMGSKDVHEYTPVAAAMADAFQLHSSHITPSTLAAWAPTHAPLLHTVFASWMSFKCLGPRSKVSYDGLSFNRLAYHLLGYSGPTLLVITDSNGATTGAASNYMYYNTKGVVLPRGLGFGGTTSKCRLFLDDELDNCTSALKCASYEPGAVAMKGSFHIETLEVLELLWLR
ncbi:hypothetical protein B5M09_005289 [Aphanomyces astaci]|uniref:TLDc domain-containing protein n=2 Tax=Aphanomyces astaci TaxID=112090 RepID=A0A425CWN1_APHAT|nr:hypothetical protein B5M09_005289 [Aphanomyces astaci]